MDPKDIVKRGYDQASLQYRGDAPDKRCERYGEWLEEIELLLPAGQAVLDLGCGNGVPTSVRLSKNYSVIGIDLSPVQVTRARRLVPGAKFLCQDMADAKLPTPDGYFGAVVSFYAFIHLPRHEIRPTLDKVFRWLAPGGLFMATIGFLEWEGMEDNWLGSGAPMYWCHPDQNEFIRIMTEAGLQLLRTDFVPEGKVGQGHGLILARKEQA